ncbi:hypothetical protein [Saccharopolyspora shandongensis]|uniref:hypothetical protein n=1 Tax=Saccharopolyspora shandongensis TaxID=418495 RepID=UPI0033F920C3
MLQYHSQAFNPDTGCWETFNIEPYDGCSMDDLDLSAQDIGCEPGTVFRVELRERDEETGEDRLIDAVELAAG